MSIADLFETNYIINHANDETMLCCKMILFKFALVLFLVVYRPARSAMHSQITIRRS